MQGSSGFRDALSALAQTHLSAHICRWYIPRYLRKLKFLYYVPWLSYLNDELELEALLYSSWLHGVFRGINKYTNCLMLPFPKINSFIINELSDHLLRRLQVMSKSYLLTLVFVHHDLETAIIPPRSTISHHKHCCGTSAASGNESYSMNSNTDLISLNTSQARHHQNKEVGSMQRGVWTFLTRFLNCRWF